MNTATDITRLTDNGISALLAIAAGDDIDAAAPISNRDRMAIADLMERRSGVRPSVDWLRDIGRPVRWRAV